jgi:hypothetical protein
LKEVYHLVGMRGGQPTAQTGTLMSTSSTATTDQTVIPTSSTTGAPNAGPQASGSREGGFTPVRPLIGGGGSHNWPDELMDIVQEPMTHTLDRMKKYSSSGQVGPLLATGAACVCILQLHTNIFLYNNAYFIEEKRIFFLKTIMPTH